MHIGEGHRALLLPQHAGPGQVHAPARYELGLRPPAYVIARYTYVYIRVCICIYTRMSQCTI